MWKCVLMNKKMSTMYAVKSDVCVWERYAYIDGSKPWCAFETDGLQSKMTLKMSDPVHIETRCFTSVDLKTRDSWDCIILWFCLNA